MSPLRRRLIEDMQIRNLSRHTQRAYVEQVARFGRYFRRSPEYLGPSEKGISVLDTLRVRHLAHLLWEQQGRPNGQELDRWLEAERRLSKDHKTLGKLKRNKRDVDGKKKKKKG
jgi:hypothetical protein